VIAFNWFAAKTLRSVPPANDEPFREEVCALHSLLIGWQLPGTPDQATPFNSKLGRIMKLNFRKFFVLTALLAAFCFVSAGRIAAQSAAQAVGASQTSPVPARITKAIDETRLVQLKGNVHPIAQARYDQGALNDTAQVARAVVLLQRSADQEAALAQLLDDQQNKSSANFHAWLTPDQFGKQYGPADSDVQTVTQWLNSHGFKNIQVNPGKTTIEFSGNVGQIRETFHTEIHKYLYHGEMHAANVSNPQIPEALSPVVAGVVGLHNFAPRAHAHRVGTFEKNNSTGQLKPLFTFTGGICGGVGNCFGVAPADFATIYNLNPLYTTNITGAGVTIAVVGDSNINAQDVIDFRNMFGLPANFTATNNIVVNGPDPGISGPNGDEIEADLDTQWSGAVAPGAKVILVVTEQPQSGLGAAGVDLSALYVVNNNLADVMSKSFGSCEAAEGAGGSAFESAIYQQASAQGITVTVSAGDNGSAGCDPTSTFPDVASQGLGVSGDASTPYNVAVGGTDFNQNASNISTFWNTTITSPTPPGLASALGYIPETTWNNTCAAGGVASACTASVISSASANQAGSEVVAGSGGASAIYAKPSWQTGLGVPTTPNARFIPDVSLFASSGINGSFYLLCEQDANNGTGSTTSSCQLNSQSNDFQGVGGTSASSPAFAAIIALVNQKTGSRQGNVNYVLYPLAAGAGHTCTSAASPAAGCIFYDINPSTVANISVACQGGTVNCSNTSAASTAFGIMATTTGGSTPAFVTTAGYDLATGLGSVNAFNLVTNWAAATTTATATTFSLNGGTAVNDVHGASVSVSGTVTPAPGAVTFPGFIELIQGTTVPGPIIDTFNVNTNGTYSGITTMLPGTNGTAYSVVAHYSGDGALRGSTSAAQTVTTVGKEASKTSLGLVTFDANNNPLPVITAPTTLPYGSAYILQIAVTNNSGTLCTPPPVGALNATTALACPTGSVSLTDSGQPLKDFLVPNTTTTTNTVTLNNGGFVEDQPIQLGGGSHSIAATYAGDASFNASAASNTLSLTITPAATVTTMQTVPGTVTAGATTNLSAIVTTQSNSSQGPTGTIQFMSGTTPVGTPATCVPAGATSSAGATCTATATGVTLSIVLPPGSLTHRRSTPPSGILLLLVAMALILAYLATRLSNSRQRRFAYAMALILVVTAIGVAGCGGGSGGGGGGGHTDSVTAVYSGDANYKASTSAPLLITVQ
jgi:subtilase family serine protease